MSKISEEVKKVLTTPPKVEVRPTDKDFLSWGVTGLNLGCWGRSTCGIPKGHIVHLAGKASAGKTFVGRTILAEAAINPEFKDYQLVYDDIEHGALMDTKKFFGQRLVERLLPPAQTKLKVPIYSSTVDDLLSRIRKRLDAGKKFVWIADSLDALMGTNEGKMTDNKAKAYSQGFRRLMNDLKANGSILVLVSQARANVGGGPFEPEDIVAGGRALEHYPTLSVWLRKAATLKKEIKGYEYAIGVRVSARIRKNRISGVDRTVEFPLYYSHGIDDVQANVEFLINKGHWKKEKATEEQEVVVEEDEQKGRAKRIVAAPEFAITGNVEDIVRAIDAKNKQRELQVLTAKVWHQIEAACTVQRKPRYS